MAGSAGEPIVTDGLVLCLDAANSKSYPGSGAVWRDLSGNGFDGVLANGPSYSPSFGGSINMDNVDDRITGPLVCSKTYYSVDFWCYPTLLGSWYWFMYLNGIWNGFSVHTTATGGVYVGTTASLRMTPWRDGVYERNKWHNFTWTFDNGTATFYKNTILERTQSVAVYSGVGFTSFGFGGPINQSGDLFNCPGNISNFKVYSNKVLSPAEIQQNFDATRSRYGL